MATAKTTGVVVRTRVTKRLRDDFDRVARRNGRSFAEELRRVMQSHVADNATHPEEGLQQ